jgi:hypothetical protein
MLSDDIPTQQSFTFFLTAFNYKMIIYFTSFFTPFMFLQPFFFIAFFHMEKGSWSFGGSHVIINQYPLQLFCDILLIIAFGLHYVADLSLFSIVSVFLF